MCLYCVKQICSISNIENYLKPSSHLACDVYTEPVNWSYPPFRAASASLPCRDCAIFVRFHGLRRLYDLVSRWVWQILKNRKIVARGHVVDDIAQSPHGHCAMAKRDRTANARFLVDMEAKNKSYEDCTFVRPSYSNRKVVASCPYSTREIARKAHSHLTAAAPWPCSRLKMGTIFFKLWGLLSHVSFPFLFRCLYAVRRLNNNYFELFVYGICSSNTNIDVKLYT